MTSHDHVRTAAGTDGPGSALTVDPVCAMSVDPATAKHVGEHNGTTYYFCAPGCKRAFLSDPGRYLAPLAPPATRVALPMLRLGHTACGDSCGCG